MILLSSILNKTKRACYCFKKYPESDSRRLLFRNTTTVDDQLTGTAIVLAWQSLFSPTILLIGIENLLPVCLYYLFLEQSTALGRTDRTYLEKGRNGYISFNFVYTFFRWEENPGMSGLAFFNQSDILCSKDINGNK